MEFLKKWFQRVFIDGLSGMALGLFSTLIIGTIIQQISSFVGGSFGSQLYMIGKVASILTGAGIGCGVAYKYKESPLVVLSSATAGMVGAYASKILTGTLLVKGAVVLNGPGEPLGAFIAAYVAIEVGHIISGRTGIDIILTPALSIFSGSFVGILIGPGVSSFMADIGGIINWGTENGNPFIMGMVVSVVMGMVLTLPISSAALGIILHLSGLAAGAATVGCCANMIGFAVISFRENGFGGLIAQGLGTSMLQVPNIVKKPTIWLPVILSSAILGPVSTMIFHMKNSAAGCGMGTAGLVGQITTYETMVSGGNSTEVLVKIVLLHIILPAILSLGIAEMMRKRGWITGNDLKLDI